LMFLMGLNRWSLYIWLMFLMGLNRWSLYRPWGGVWESINLRWVSGHRTGLKQILCRGNSSEEIVMLLNIYYRQKCCTSDMLINCTIYTNNTIL
jgi:hypothetical protein